VGSLGICPLSVPRVYSLRWQECYRRLTGSERIWDRGAALTSRLQTFETEMLAEEEDFAGLARLNQALFGKAEAMDSGRRTVLDMDSKEIPVYGEQEQSASNGYFESTCFHPLLLFNREGDCLAAKLRPGNLQSALGCVTPQAMKVVRQAASLVSPASKYR
jgi:hypothetical protein